jgi:hypothetical protein
MGSGDNNGYVVKTVFWTLILCSFAFSAGSYAFTWSGGTRLADAVVCNDRVRQSENKTLEAKIETYQREIIQRLSRIEAMMGK